MLSWEEHGEAQLGAKWVDAQNTFFKKLESWVKWNIPVVIGDWGQGLLELHEANQSNINDTPLPKI